MSSSQKANAGLFVSKQYLERGRLGAKLSMARCLHDRRFDKVPYKSKKEN